MRAILALEDGTWFEGRSFTGEGETSGEVIFNTGMSGYQEILTDPSYYGQLVCMTYPLIGNYGVNPEDVESSRIHCPAMIVKECCKEPSNWRSTESLPEYLMRHGVMGLEGIDTRALTRHLRIHGAMRGVISTSDLTVEELTAKARALPSMEGANLVDFVAPREPYSWTGTAPAPARASGCCSSTATTGRSSIPTRTRTTTPPRTATRCGTRASPTKWAHGPPRCGSRT